MLYGWQRPRAYRGGGGQVCQGTILTEIISEGENVATSRNSETCCYFLVGSGWFILFTSGHCQNPGQHGIPMHLSHTTTACCKQIPSAWYTPVNHAKLLAVDSW